MIDYTLNLIAGTDIPVPECQMVIHQPTIKELSLIGENVFETGAKYLSINKSLFSQDEINLSGATNFQIFMTVMNSAEGKPKKEDVVEVLKLLLPEYKCSFTPRALMFIGGEQPLMIDDNNFDIFQSVILDVFCLKGAQGEDFNPKKGKAEEIAAKLKRARQRVAAQKAAENKNLISTYLSVLTVGLHISLLELVKLTVYQLYDLIQRYNLWITWDLDIRSRLAGASPDGDPENWMKNIH